jgi:two-component system, OmpR family, sensor histidine kinase KdpD
VKTPHKSAEYLADVPLWQYGAAIIVVVVCTLIAFPLRRHLADANLVMIYLIGVVAVAAKLHRRVALFTSVLSVAAFDFFCVPHYFSFAVADSEYLITLAVMLAVALLISTMTSRIRQQEASAAEREARVETESMRTSLLSAVSHDLRTPLSSITGAAATLRSHWDRLDPNTRDELLKTVTDESDRLNRLLNNLIQVTRLESGVVLRKDWFPLEEVIGAALHRLKSQIGNKRVQTDIPADLPLVAMDDVLMEQVFINLFENALKYTPETSPVEILARNRNGVVEVRVLDRGSGFAPGHEHRVFDKFFRGRTDEVRGAGLGLAICRAIIEAHGGSISAQNRRDGGAMIRFQIPIGGQQVEFGPHVGGNRG